MSEVVIPEQCADCPVAKMLSGEALEFLVQNCTGIKIRVLGCDKILVCDSPQKDLVET